MSNAVGGSPSRLLLTQYFQIRSLGRSIAKRFLVSAAPVVPASVEVLAAFRTMSGRPNSPIIVGTEKSRRVTAKLAQLISGLPDEARWPSNAAVVMPPAHSEIVLAVSLPMISQAVRTDSSTAST